MVLLVMLMEIKKLNNRLFHEENLENIRRVKEIESKNIPKDRSLERIQISQGLKKKLENRSKKV